MEIVHPNTNTLLSRLRIIAISLMLLLTAAVPFAVAAHSDTPPVKAVNLIWHNDQLWNTVVLGNIHGNAPSHTLDEFYVIPGQNPVAGAGPGDSDYNGGRWLPTILEWAEGVEPDLLTDGDTVEAAIASGDLVIMDTGTPFLCPLTNRNA